LTKKYSQLIPLYHQEWGRIHSKTYKKHCKALRLEKAFYVLLEGQIISSAVTKQALQKTIEAIVPEQKQAWVYVFKM